MEQVIIFGETLFLLNYMLTNRLFPDFFVKSIETKLGSETELFFNALKTEGPISIRINPKKESNASGLEPVPWSQYGFYLPERPIFTLDPRFHSGAYYVQEASSMFLEQVIKQNTHPGQTLKVLDLCGAPGGKSTHLASLISPESLLVSNEVIRSRSYILAENVSKWGYPNVVVTNNDPSSFKHLPCFFDIIVVDAPCSGEGMFRKDPLAINEWSEENVNLCALRQRRIVADVWEALKPGGILIYSTCTFNSKENEENLGWMESEWGAQTLPIDIESFRGVIQTEGFNSYRFFPHKIKGEGFFIAAVQKPDGPKTNPGRIKKIPLQKASGTPAVEVIRWIKMATMFNLWQFKERILAFPSTLSNELFQLVDKLNIVQCGIEIGEVKARNTVLSHAFALSTLIDTTAFGKETLNKELAIKFLRKEEIAPVKNDPYLLVLYENNPLGWLKKAGNRYNNQYPKEWRIRMMDSGH